MRNPRVDSLISTLTMQPHPEGGRYVEIHRSADLVRRDGRDRSAGTAIHFLLERGERSRWHVVDADEIWIHNEGDPLELITLDPATKTITHTVLAPPDAHGARPMAVVPRGVWQAARPLGEYTLVACTVSPGFEFAGFALCADLDGTSAIVAAMPDDLRGLL
ncbi:MAG: cupin domain-containing protein [Thermoanaerobaculia bacterium]